MSKLICISAANIRHNPRGTSFRVCELAGAIAGEISPEIETAIIPLVEYEFTPCTGCGRCFHSGSCCQEDDFNHVMATINRADGLIVVSAHYAPIPSKLAMLLEKAEQIAFLPRFHDDSRRSPLYGRPAGIIGHGGGTTEIMEGYKNVVLRTIANALAYPIDMDIIRIGEDQVPGVIFPVKQVSKNPGYPFPHQEYDWTEIRLGIAPLVREVVTRISKQKKD